MRKDKKENYLYYYGCVWMGRCLPQVRYIENIIHMSCSKIHFKKLFVLCFMQDDPVGNINLAMEIAEKHLDIPKMLDAEGETNLVLLTLIKSISYVDFGHAWGFAKLYSQVTSEELRIPQ